MAGVPRLLLLVAAAAVCTATAGALEPVDLRVNNLLQRNAAGIVGPVRLSWGLAGTRRGDAQAVARVVLCMSAPPAPCQVAFDSGTVLGPTQHMDVPSRLFAHSKFAWNVTITSLLDGSIASASASFITGIADSYNATSSVISEDWAGAAWLQGLPAATYHSRIRHSFNVSGTVLQAIVTLAHSGNVVAYVNGLSIANDEWRCRSQTDVAWCSTTREVDAAALVGNGAENVIAFAASESPAGLADWYKLRLTLWLDSGVVDIVSDAATAPSFHAGVSSERYMGQQGMNDLSFTFDQGFEAVQHGWTAPGFNETAASNYDPTRGWTPCIPISAGGGDCVVDIPESHTAVLSCGTSSIVSVAFASFGTPQGTCGGFVLGSCNAPASAQVVANACVGKHNCSIFVSVPTFGADPCLGTAKHLSAQVVCSGPAPPPTPFDFPTRPNPVATRVVSTWAPVALTVTEPAGSYVWSLAQNIAGSCSISFPGITPAPALKGVQVQFLFGERLYANGSVFNMYGYQFNFTQQLTVELDGSGAAFLVNTSLLQWTFQYVGVTGWPVDAFAAPALSALECYQIASDAPSRGSFASSDGLLNAIAVMHVQTIINSNQVLPLSDPERDNIDWLGDSHLAAHTALSFLDSGAFYEQSLAMIGDSEVHCERLGPYTASPFIVPYIVPTTGTGLDAQPCVGWFGNAPGFEWSVAFHVFADVVARHYNDTRVIATYYDGLARLIDSVQPFVTNGLLTAAIFGDWANEALALTPDVCVCGLFTQDQHRINSSAPCACQGTTTPNIMGGGWSVGYYYVYALDAMYRFATALGADADAERYFGLAAAARATFGETFVVQGSTGNWTVRGGAECPACMGAAALALQTAGGPVMDPQVTADVCAHLIAALAAKGGRLDTGVLSTKALLPALARSCGAWDEAFALATQTALPSYGYWLSLGITTTCEQWWETGTPNVTGGALNHPMFATFAQFFVEGFGGIDAAAAMTTTAIEAFPISPVIPAGLATASASVLTPRGLVACSWAQNITTPSISMLPLSVNVTVPPGASAALDMPFPRIILGPGGAFPASLLVTENGNGTGATVWSQGEFFPGTSGVVGAELLTPAWPLEWYTLRLTVLSGEYVFRASESVSAA